MPEVRAEPTAAEADTPRRENCPVCRADDLAEGESRRCSECGFAFYERADGILTGTGPNSAIEYPPLGTELTFEIEDRSFWFRHRNAVVRGLFERHDIEGTVWDVGGGNGHLTRALLQAGRDVVLVEPMPRACENALARGIPCVFEATLEGLCLPAERVDAMILSEVLEHLEDPEAVLREAFRVLKPGGGLVVTVPAFGWLWSDEDNFACHKRRYTRKGISEAIRSAGFEIEFASYAFGCLLLPVLLLRAVPYRLSFWQRGEKTMDPSEHQPGAGLRLLEFFLSRERHALSSGRSRPWGTTVVCIARRPD